jgi:hypothetical protein
LAILIPFHILEVDDPTLEDVESTLCIKRFEIVVEGDLYAPDSGFLQVPNGFEDDVRTDLSPPTSCRRSSISRGSTGPSLMISRFILSCQHQQACSAPLDAIVS